ncbi:MAG: hypothetical protein AAF841_14595, partial [Pseudomonadota bacterium]
MAPTIDIDTLIIGFGFSCIPLVRELENEARDFKIISSGTNHWNELRKRDRLDFDLVSSKHSSYYSFELVGLSTEDAYPTAREFHDLHLKYLARYQHRVIEDWVEHVENYADHSLVRTKRGDVYRAQKLVFATAFKRKITNALIDFDYDAATGKTVVVTSSGDSANLMISKLVPRGAKIIQVTNGFVALDKYAALNGKRYTLDQLEVHNFAYYWPRLYRSLGSMGITVVSFLPEWVGRVFFGANFFVRYPRFNALRRPFLRQAFKAKSPVPNGWIAIKYWPIDTYKDLFDGERLEASIEAGYLLNDIAYFVDQGLVSLWPKSETEIDARAGLVRRDGQGEGVAFDFLIEGDREVPNLPPIFRRADGADGVEYEYEHRNTFMGVMPAGLSNVFFIGFTRPTTGGLANIIEMQGLFAHRLTTDDSFRARMQSGLAERINAYNSHHYASETASPQDHLVYAGFYTEAVARLLEIAPRLRDCRSLRDLLEFFIFPNNAFKYRQDGAYRVDGIKAMIDGIWRDHDGFSAVIHYLANFWLFQALIGATLLLSPLPLWVSLPLAIAQIYNPLNGLLIANGTQLHIPMNYVLGAGLLASLVTQSALVGAATLGLAAGWIFLGRKLGWSRPMFGDLREKQKPKYKEFFKRYCAAFNRAVAARAEKPAA